MWLFVKISAISSHNRHIKSLFCVCVAYMVLITYHIYILKPIKLNLTLFSLCICQYLTKLCNIMCHFYTKTPLPKLPDLNGLKYSYIIVKRYNHCMYDFSSLLFNCYNLQQTNGNDLILTLQKVFPLFPLKCYRSKWYEFMVSSGLMYLVLDAIS